MNHTEQQPELTPEEISAALKANEDRMPPAEQRKPRTEAEAMDLIFPQGL